VNVTSVRSLAEAYGVLARKPPGLRVLAGGTDLMVQINARVGIEGIRHVLDIWRLGELRGITLASASGSGPSPAEPAPPLRDGMLRLGALTTYSELMRSPLVREKLPALALVSREVGAWAIQNRGTIGGNVCNASPAGDTLPLLIAADARFVLGGPRGERTVAADAFFVGYRKTAMDADELLLRVDVPVLGRLVYRKVGTRRAQSISKTLIAVRARAREGLLFDVRVGAGCVAPVPLRCRTAEAALEGKALDEAALAAARAGLDADIVPIDDVRSTAVYRRRVSGIVLERLVRSLSP